MKNCINIRICSAWGGAQEEGGRLPSLVSGALGGVVGAIAWQVELFSFSY